MTTRTVTETIEWVFTDDELPDEDVTVMLFAPHLDEKVWLGWLDEGEWRTVCGATVDCEVIAWADVPMGPPKINESSELCR